MLDKAIQQVEEAGDIIAGGSSADAKAWLEDWKQPLTSLATNTIVDALTSVTNGMSRSRLKGLYASLSPQEMVAVAQANAQAFKHVATVAAKEALLIRSAQEQMARATTSLVLRGITTVLAAL